MRNVWNELLEFETRDLIERHFMLKHKSEVNAWKVAEVASNFIQAREYFESAKDAGFTVRPLLLYYGVLSLSRALILTLNPWVKEMTLKPSHGLEITNWSSILLTKEFEKLELKVGTGTFSELTFATENRNYLMANSDAINWCIGMIAPPKGCTIQLQQIYNSFPDLYKEYNTWIGKPIPFVILEALSHDGSKTKVKIRSYGVTHELLDTIFPQIHCINRDIRRGEGYIMISYEKSNLSPSFTQKWDGPMKVGIGEACVTPAINNAYGLNMISSMYAITYTFGMMARYYPSSWMALKRIEKGDKIYPLIQHALNFIEEKFPIVILNFLRAPYDFEAKV